MKKITGACDICKQEIKPAKNQAQFNRNLGWHKLTAHGIKGKSSDPEARRVAARHNHWKKAGLNEEQIAQREAEFKAKHGAAPVSSKPLDTTQQRQDLPVRRKYGEAVSIGLTECPDCHARFYITRPR